MKPKIILLGYGLMAPYAFKSLSTKFDISTLIIETAKLGDTTSTTLRKLAKANKTKVITTNDAKEIQKSIASDKPDVLVICSYNKILPPVILDQLHCINVHHGDLPRWRGRANLNWAILTGRKYVGVTIHKAVSDLDAGNIFAQYKIPITNDETIRTLYEKVNSIVLNNLANVVEKVLAGDEGKKQVGLPTYCCTRLPEDGMINWTDSSKNIDRFIRALTKPFPGAFTYFNGKKMIIWDSQIPNRPRKYEGRIPGRIILLHKNVGVEVLTGDSSIILKNVTIGSAEGLASEFIKSVKTSLGINWVQLYERIYLQQ